MRFPSLSSLAGGAARTFRRFPIAILLAAKATFLGIWWTHLIQTVIFNSVVSFPPQWYWNAIVSCYLGMLLSVAATVWVEKRRARGGAGGAGGEEGIAGRGGRDSAGRGRALAIGLQAGVIVLAGLYYLSLPAEIGAMMVIRSVVLALGLHWLIAVIGFGGGEVNAFWIFNKRLFLRILTTSLYSLVLFMGIGLALEAMERLFNLDIRSEIYEDCWWVLGGLFSVWFFLAGFPKSYENPQEISDYPKGLKIFTQYVLLSLVTIYLLILYAYTFKIIFAAHWPVGWVAWMVMFFAVAGILSLLLIFPLRNEVENTWIRSYSRFFYFALLPLIVLLFCAIYKRVAPYGITEQRYFLLVLALWLLFITLYFLVSRKKDIRLVPLSLCLLAFLSCWGPWGAFSVSLRSQEHRLRGLLEKYGLMANGKVVTGKTGVKVAMRDRKEISSVTDYLVEEHGYKVLQPWFDSNLDSVMRKDSLSNRWQAYQGSEAIVKLMNVEYANRWIVYADTATTSDMPRNFYCQPISGDSAATTDGTSYVAEFKLLPRNSDSCQSLGFAGNSLNICLDKKRNQLEVSMGSGGGISIVDLGPVIRTVLASKDVSINLPQSQLSLPLTGRPLSGKVLLTDFGGERTDSAVDIGRIEGILLFSKK